MVSWFNSAYCGDRWLNSWKKKKKKKKAVRLSIGYHASKNNLLNYNSINTALLTHHTDSQALIVDGTFLCLL